MKTQPLSEVYHQWTVLGFAYKDKHNTYYKCRCTCGVEKEIRIYDLINNKTTCCKKCSKGSSIHGLSNHDLYTTWRCMIGRCYYSNNNRYKNYGQRGISVCNEWRYDFCNFYKWAIINGWKHGLQIDRINNNKNYEPDNCRFITNLINSRNKTTTKLNKEKVKDIRFCLEQNIKIKDLAILYHVARETINGIKHYRNWKDI